MTKTILEKVMEEGPKPLDVRFTMDKAIIENCINGTSSLTINFKHQEVSDTFKVNLNNIFYIPINILCLLRVNILL